MCLRRGSLISQSVDGEVPGAVGIGIVMVVSFRQALSLAEPAIGSVSAVAQVCRLMLVLPDHDTTSLHV